MQSDAFASPNEGRYSLCEETANAASHGLGALLSAVALAFLVSAAARRAGPAETWAYAVFGLSLVLLFTMSTIYHALRASAAKRLFEILDHASIYVLIAGSYTAFCAASLSGNSAFILLTLVWGLALVGIAFKAFFVQRFRIVSTLGYLVMGWLILPFIGEVKASLSPAAFALLGLGGLAYSVGAAFYLLKRVPWFHVLWHLFVLAGAAFHVASALVAL